MRGGCSKCGDYLTRIIWHGRRGDIIECLGCGHSRTRIRSIFEPQPEHGAPLTQQKGPKP